MMRQRNLLLVVVTVLGLVVTLGLQGCLFGGGGDEGAVEGEGAEGAPAEGAEAAPGEVGEMPGEGGMGGPPPGMEGEGAPAEATDAPVAEGTAAAGGGDAEAMVDEAMAAKHDGDYVTARQQFEAAVAADDSNAEAHWGLAWIYAEMADAGNADMKPKAIEQFHKFLEIGGTADQVAEAEDALERLQ